MALKMLIRVNTPPKPIRKTLIIDKTISCFERDAILLHVRLGYPTILTPLIKASKPVKMAKNIRLPKLKKGAKSRVAIMDVFPPKNIKKRNKIKVKNFLILKKICDEIIQINQSSYSPGSFPNKRAGRNLPSSRSVYGKRKTTTCPAFFMQRPLVYLTCYTKQVHLVYLALLKTVITKPNPAFLAVQPS